MSVLIDVLGWAMLTGILAVSVAVVALALDQRRLRDLPPDPSAASKYLRDHTLHRVGLDPDDEDYTDREAA